jgi:SAM-dependent methyltransferase
LSPPKLPSDIPTGETLAFIQAHVLPPPARILEVGCGGGALASRLHRLGYAIVALDASEKAVAQAKKRGLDARRADWPNFTDRPFEVILFTRSLHHIADLPGAVARAAELLKAGGQLLVEDFARHEVRPLAAEWLYQMLAVLDASALLERDQEGLLDRMLSHGDALAAWQEAHDHHLHSAEAMLAALRGHFPTVTMDPAPYLYRYVCSRLTERAPGHAVATRVLALEKRFAATAGVPLIGRRFFAVKP